MLGLLYPSDLDLLADELGSVHTKWEALGKALRVSEKKLNDIRTHYKSDTRNCFRETLREWLPCPWLDTYWGDVVDALRSLQEDCLCSEVKTKYGELSTIMYMLRSSI